MEQKVMVEGKELTLTNLNKALWREEGITKADMIRYYTLVAPFILPYIKNRHLTTIRFPDGIEGKSFYQKNIPNHAPSWIETNQEGGVNYILANDLPTMVWLANQACIELHVSFNRVGEDYPTELVIDIDPSVEDFSKVVEVAFLMKDVLDQLKLESIIKTSGATGVQIYIPIKKGYSYEQTRKVGNFLAKYLTEQHPKLITIERWVKNRGDKVYIDYLQHWRGKTLPAPYSLRARKRAPVSTPLTWEELKELKDPTVYNMDSVFKRLEKRLNPFDRIISQHSRQSLDHVLEILDENVFV
ncbi:non-homologous end-joining DNA ligase [Microaerobacter geothermalis]|uniref:non-homologous end-joining DNA ligase n=1 Tax=Microaerobacter geothermalis TaxID=674972 RepID=UPI001F2C3716|nr:non-homologous end-joining DNA ligase [Microaerobacter geothermalis]MCF6093342.1 non-homologous end-joining DNA ligase [Microaerobacter geothermalis]